MSLIRKPPDFTTSHIPGDLEVLAGKDPLKVWKDEDGTLRAFCEDIEEFLAEQRRQQMKTTNE